MTGLPVPPVATVEVHPLVGAAEGVEQALTLLDEAERLRFAKYLDRRKAHEFATTRAFLRRLLAARAGGSPRDVPLDSTCRKCGRAYGAPRLLSPTDAVTISVTHSNGWALVAIGPPAVPIGIDLEHPEHHRSAARLHRTETLDRWAAQDWVRGEALMKAAAWHTADEPLKVHDLPLPGSMAAGVAALAAPPTTAYRVHPAHSTTDSP